MSKKSPLPPELEKELGPSLYKRLLLLLSNEDFLQEMRTLRHVYGIPEDGFDTVEERFTWQSSLKHKNYFNQLKIIRSRCAGFTKKDDALFLQYFYTNKINPIVAVPDGARVHMQTNLERPLVDDDFSINIDPGTTKEQVKSALNDYHSILKTLSQKRAVYQPHKNLESDVRIAELFEEGMSTMDIETVINKEYPQSLPSNHPDIDKYIYERAEEIKKKIKGMYKGTKS